MKQPLLLHARSSGRSFSFVDRKASSSAGLCVLSQEEDRRLPKAMVGSIEKRRQFPQN